MKTYFSASGFVFKSELEKYANRKIARIARRLPRKYRPFASCYIQLKRSTRKTTKLNTCVLILQFDDAELRAEETTQHMYSALDICAVHIESQLKKYIREHQLGLLRRHFRSD